MNTDSHSKIESLQMIQTKELDLSLVIPLLNEEESLPELVAWIHKIAQKNNYEYEILLIDDGSTDNSWQIINQLADKNACVKGIKFRRNYGKAAALHTGFMAASGQVVVTMDADLQDNPDEIPELYRMIMEDNYDLVSGWKKKRFDPLSKTIPTKLYNGVTRLMTGIKLNDFNCGLKAYKNRVVKSIEVYGEMHRYIPVLAKIAGFGNIGEKVVQHQSRKYGVTKFGGIKRFINGPLDLMVVWFTGTFGKKPMHFFGTLGMLFFFVGFVILSYLAIAKLLWSVVGIAERPMFFFGILILLIGSQLFLTGFVAEMINRNATERNHYLIENKIGL